MAEAIKSPPDAKVILHDVGWETYEMLVEDDPTLAESPTRLVGEGLRAERPTWTRKAREWAASLAG